MAKSDLDSAFIKKFDKETTLADAKSASQSSISTDKVEETKIVRFSSYYRTGRYVVETYRDEHDHSKELVAEFRNHQYETDNPKMIKYLRELVASGGNSIWEGEMPDYITKTLMKHRNELTATRGTYEPELPYVEAD